MYNSGVGTSKTYAPGKTHRQVTEDKLAFISDYERTTNWGLYFKASLAEAAAAEEVKGDRIKSETKPKVKTPPVSAKKHRRASPLGEGAKGLR